MWFAQMLNAGHQCLNVLIQISTHPGWTSQMHPPWRMWDPVHPKDSDTAWKAAVKKFFDFVKPHSPVKPNDLGYVEHSYMGQLNSCAHLLGGCLVQVPWTILLVCE